MPFTMFNVCGAKGSLLAAIRACERSMSGAENGAERAENGVSGSGAVSGF